MPPDLVHAAVVIGVLASLIRISTPILLSALGVLVTNRAGVMNLGFEGIMLMGAFVGFLTASQTGSLTLAALAAAIAGGLLSLIVAFLASTMKVDQVIPGIALNLLASGATAFWYRVAFKATASATIPSVRTMGNFEIPLLSEIPFLGEVLFTHSVMTYLAFLMVPVVWFFLYRTKYGLEIRCLGENPRAIDTKGLNVARLQYLAVIFGGVMGGLGGAYLTLGSAGIFIPDMTAGRGWLAIVVVIAGNWKPYRIALAALIFSFLEAFQLQVQGVGFQLPYQLLLALPYVLAILFLIGSRARSQAPGSLGIPFLRE